MMNHTVSLFKWVLYTIKCLFGTVDVFVGEQTVAGEGEVRIKLPMRFVGDACVDFVDEPEACVPCDPGQDDWVICCVEKECHHSMLKIKWKVSGTRTVAWTICY